MPRHVFALPAPQENQTLFAALPRVHVSCALDVCGTTVTVVNILEERLDEDAVSDAKLNNRFTVNGGATLVLLASCSIKMYTVPRRHCDFCELVLLLVLSYCSHRQKMIAESLLA